MNHLNHQMKSNRMGWEDEVSTFCEISSGIRVCTRFCEYEAESAFVRTCPDKDLASRHCDVKCVGVDIHYLRAGGGGRKVV